MAFSVSDGRLNLRKLKCFFVFCFLFPQLWSSVFPKTRRQPGFHPRQQKRSYKCYIGECNSPNKNKEKSKRRCSEPQKKSKDAKKKNHREEIPRREWNEASMIEIIAERGSIFSSSSYCITQPASVKDNHLSIGSAGLITYTARRVRLLQTS